MLIGMSWWLISWATLRSAHTSKETKPAMLRGTSRAIPFPFIIAFGCFDREHNPACNSKRFKGCRMIKTCRQRITPNYSERLRSLNKWIIITFCPIWDVSLKWLKISFINMKKKLQNERPRSMILYIFCCFKLSKLARIFLVQMTSQRSCAVFEPDFRFICSGKTQIKIT